jgi:hypothetical protein
MRTSAPNPSVPMTAPAVPPPVVEATNLAARVALRPLLPPEKTTAHRAGMVQTECPYCRASSCFATDVEFRCEECGGAGGVIEYCMARDSRTEAEATEWLASRALTAEESARYTERRGAAALANDVARKWYHAQFLASEAAVAWWERRGYTLDRAKLEMVGWAPPDARIFLDGMKDAYVSREALIDAGLVIPGRTAGTVTVRFRNRLLFPITDDRDVSTIAFTGRVTQHGIIAPLGEAPHALRTRTGASVNREDENGVSPRGAIRRTPLHRLRDPKCRCFFGHGIHSGSRRTRSGRRSRGQATRRDPPCYLLRRRCGAEGA